MKSIRLFTILIMLIVSSLACRIPGLGSAETSAPPLPIEATENPLVQEPEEVASQEIPPTEMPVDEPTSEPIADLTCTSMPDFEFCFPKELASALVASKMPRVEDNGMVGPWEVMPEHYVIEPNGYPLTDTFLKPRIHVIPAADYATMIEGALMMQNYLMELMASRDPNPSNLPILPILNAGSVFISRVKYLESGKLHGVEGLTQLAQSFSVINNHELIYTFQGMTNDDRYWVGIILPITHNSLPADQSGNPYGDDYETFMEQYQTYTAAISQTLANSPDDTFTPNYAFIQKVVELINYLP